MRAIGDSLAPRPRRVLDGAGQTARLGPLVAAAPDSDAASVRAALGAAWRIVSADVPAAAVFRRAPHVEGPQSYRLRVTPEGIECEAEDRAGLFYAATTLNQLMRLAEDGRLPLCEINDRPDFAARGVMLDVSRDKTPTLATLRELVDLLAGYKINQLQLYTEHAFAYRGHEEVWRDASPLTPDDIRALDVYCRARCVELVPNQNSFGHLARWLSRPRYNVLAELPQGGAPLPWGGAHERPTTLCPTDPRSEAFLAGLYDDLLPNFSSRLFNVGCDETFDLRGAGRSAARARQIGEGRVYLEFLKRIHRLAQDRGRSIQFWADIVLRHPDLTAELPRDGTALVWGYEADHPFEAQTAGLARAGIPFYVCPGTSSWNSLAGRTTNMLENARQAAMCGARHGARGFLMTDWGDNGHWQPLAVSLPAMARGAALAWRVASNLDADPAVQADIGATDGLGRILLDLGDAYRFCGAQHANATELFRILAHPRTRPPAPGVTRQTLEQTLERVEHAAARLPTGRSDTLALETRQAARLLRVACLRGLEAMGGGTIASAAPADEAAAMIASQVEVWRLRNREGGLADSLARFSHLEREYGLPPR